MRDTLESSLPDTCTISRASSAADALGGQTLTWSTIATVACRVSPTSGVSGREDTRAARDTAVAPWMVTLPALTDVTAADRIVFGARTFEVLDVAARMSWELDTRCACQEVT